MTIDDTAQIKALAQSSKQDDYRLRTVIEQLVMSELFQTRQAHPHRKDPRRAVRRVSRPRQLPRRSRREIRHPGPNPAS